MNNRRLAVLTISLALPLLFSMGCKAQDDITPGPTPKQTGPDVIVNNQNQPPEHLIQVAGFGEMKTVPDYATITLSVQSNAETAEAASAKCEENLAGVLDAAVALGVSRGDIKDAGITITAVTRESDDAITGYTAADVITITAHNVSTANSVVSGIVDASSSELKSVTYSITDTTTAYRGALAAAMADAAEKAATVAQAGGFTLGAVVGVTETTTDQDRLIGASFETSEIAVPARVTVQYLIK